MTTVPTTTATPPANSVSLCSRSLWLLRAAGFVSNFDRFCITPMLVLIAAQLGAGMATAVLTASVYFLCYGLMQPVWGLAGDRLGRVRVMRLSLTAGTVSSLLSGLAPDLTFLIVARALAGACFAACVPASLSYVGDVVPAEVRQRPLSDLMTAFSLGTALGTVVAGALAHYAGWRTVFLLPGLVAACLARALRHLAEPEREPAGSCWRPSVSCWARGGCGSSWRSPWPKGPYCWAS
ncbi:MFS transporter [Streptomyces lydicus]|nr:MFS transporter [Streptomyces lydicus]